MLILFVSQISEKILVIPIPIWLTLICIVVYIYIQKKIGMSIAVFTVGLEKSRCKVYVFFGCFMFSGCCNDDNKVALPNCRRGTSFLFCALSKNFLKRRTRITLASGFLRLLFVLGVGWLFSSIISHVPGGRPVDSSSGNSKVPELIAARNPFPLFNLSDRRIPAFINCPRRKRLLFPRPFHGWIIF